INDLTDNNLNLANLDTESIVIQAGDNITFADTSDTITTAGGDIHLEADSPHATGGADGAGTLTLGNLDSEGGDITLIGADMVFNGTIDATSATASGNVYISHSGGGSNPNILLGSPTSAATDDIELTDAEIDNITCTGTVTIGEATTAGSDGAGTGAQTLTAGNITVDDLTPANFSNLVLKSSGTINDSDDAGDAIAIGTLSLIGATGIGTTSTFNIDADTLSASTTNSAIDITDSDGVIISSLNSGTANASLTAGGDVTDSGQIIAATLTVNTTGAAAGGAITLDTASNDVDTLNLQSGNNSNITFTDADDVDIALLNAGTGTITLNAGGNVTQSGAITAGTFSASVSGGGSIDFSTQTNNITNLGAVTAPGGFALDNGNNSLTINGSLSTTNNNISIDVGTGTLTTNATISSGTGDITLTADGIALGANISGSGDLLLQPSTTTTSIGIGGGAGTFNLDDTEIGYLQDGFSSITIGRSDGQHAIDISTVTFNDPVTIQTPSGGSITVNGQITGSGDASVTLDGPGATTTLNADIITAGQDITIDDNVVIGEGWTITLSTGATSAGDIHITGTTSGTAGGVKENLTLVSGSGTTTLDGAVGAGGNIGTLTIQANNANCTGAVTFNGDVTVDTITTYSQAYSITFNEDVSVTNDTTFLNTNGITLGNGDDDVLLFTGGLDTTACGTTTARGTIRTVSQQMDIGNLTISGGSLTLDTTNNWAGTGAALNITGTVTGGGNNLTLISGTSATTVSGAVNNVGTLALQADNANATGALTFNGDVTTTTLTTYARAYSVAFNEDLTVTNACTFNNTNGVTLGNGDDDILTFNGGLTSTASTTTVHGTIQTSNDALTLGAVTVGGTTELNAGTATLTTGAITAGANDITLTADEIDFTGGNDSNTGTGNIVLQPATAGQDIEITGGGGTAALDLTATDLATLADGFNSITIGRSDGTGTITVAAATTFNDPVTLRAPQAGGSIVVNGQITGSGDASVTLDGSGATTTLNANIVTAGNPIT
ncbi:hypothetical protein DRN74_06610, partial [Candidatus Micrarchaeota archaeon]